MAKWGKFNFRELEKFAQRLQKAQKEQVIEQFIRDFLLEMAMRSLRKIKMRTPVGKDTPSPGQLRNNWQVGNVEKHGDMYQIEIYNNTHYAGFVEYGHRTGKDLTKWVEGRFMMTISMQEIERELPRYLEKRMAELLDNIINGRPPKKEE